MKKQSSIKKEISSKEKINKKNKDNVVDIKKGEVIDQLHKQSQNLKEYLEYLSACKKEVDKESKF